MNRWMKRLSLFLVLALIFSYFPSLEHQVSAAGEDYVYVTAIAYPQNCGQVKSQSEPDWSDMVQEYANVGAADRLSAILLRKPQTDTSSSSGGKMACGRATRNSWRS